MSPRYNLYQSILTFYFGCRLQTYRYDRKLFVLILKVPSVMQPSDVIGARASVFSSVSKLNYLYSKSYKTWKNVRGTLMMHPLLVVFMRVTVITYFNLQPYNFLNSMKLFLDLCQFVRFSHDRKTAWDCIFSRKYNLIIKNTANTKYQQLWKLGISIAFEWASWSVFCKASVPVLKCSNGS